MVVVIVFAKTEESEISLLTQRNFAQFRIAAYYFLFSKLSYFSQCTKNENLVTFTEKSLMENFIFCAVSSCVTAGP